MRQDGYYGQEGATTEFYRSGCSCRMEERVFETRELE